MDTLQFYLKTSHLVLHDNFSHLLFRPCRTWWRFTSWTTHNLSSTKSNVKELEAFARHLPVEMALASFTCQVCILWLKVTDWKVKIALSTFPAQQGVIILPLRAILAGVYVHHMGKTPHSALRGFIRMDHLSPHLSSMLKTHWTKIRGSYVECLWEVVG